MTTEGKIGQKNFQLRRNFIFEALNEKLFSNLDRAQKSVATPAL